MSETKYDPNCVSYVTGNLDYCPPEDILDLTTPATAQTATLLVTYDKKGGVLHADKYNPNQPRLLDGRCGDSGEIIIYREPIREEYYPDGSPHTQFRRIKPVEPPTPTSRPA